MMIDIAKLTKQELTDMAKWKCPVPGHSKHNGLAHPNCYKKLNKQPNGERVAFFDIESEDLSADYGIIFCWVVIDAQTGKVYKDVITSADIQKYKSIKREVEPKEDTRVVKSLVDCLANYDRVVGHYSSRFDLPFVRTRAVICGVDFPTYGLLYQSDTWMTLRLKFKLSRNSLENSCRKLLGQTRKDHLSLSIKHGCLRAEKWALEVSLKHCEQDVLDLRDLYNKICNFARKTKTSI